MTPHTTLDRSPTRPTAIAGELRKSEPPLTIPYGLDPTAGGIWNVDCSNERVRQAWLARADLASQWIDPMAVLKWPELAEVFGRRGVAAHLAGFSRVMYRHGVVERRLLQHPTGTPRRARSLYEYRLRERDDVQIAPSTHSGKTAARAVAIRLLLDEMTKAATERRAIQPVSSGMVLVKARQVGLHVSHPECTGAIHQLALVHPHRWQLFHATRGCMMLLAPRDSELPVAISSCPPRQTHTETPAMRAERMVLQAIEQSPVGAVCVQQLDQLAREFFPTHPHPMQLVLEFVGSRQRSQSTQLIRLGGYGRRRWFTSHAARERGEAFVRLLMTRDAIRRFEERDRLGAAGRFRGHELVRSRAQHIEDLLERTRAALAGIGQLGSNADNADVAALQQEITKAERSLERRLNATRRHVDYALPEQPAASEATAQETWVSDAQALRFAHRLMHWTGQGAVDAQRVEQRITSALHFARVRTRRHASTTLGESVGASGWKRDLQGKTRYAATEIQHYLYESLGTVRLRRLASRVRRAFGAVPPIATLRRAVTDVDPILKLCALAGLGLQGTMHDVAALEAEVRTAPEGGHREIACWALAMLSPNTARALLDAGSLGLDPTVCRELSEWTDRLIDDPLPRLTE